MLTNAVFILRTRYSKYILKSSCGNNQQLMASKKS